MIQSTIINDLIQADLVIADLTEHNPNVKFELSVRMAQDKPVVLMKAEVTGPLFDVDNMLSSTAQICGGRLWRRICRICATSLRVHGRIATLKNPA